MQRWLTDPLEAALLWLALGFFGLLKPETASNAGGWLARAIGPRLPLSERARRNLRHVLPELSKGEIESVVRATWENHGRVFAEMPHVNQVIERGNVFAAPEALALLRRVKDAGQPVVLVGGHLANFEVFGALILANGFSLTAIYRAPNNPLVDRIWRRLRGAAHLVPKSTDGGREALRVLSGRGNLGVLVDQKFNEGIAVPFFGKPAMTTAAPAHFAQRFKAAIVFGWAERLGPARYRIHAELVEPVAPAGPGAAARGEAIAATTARINEHLERRVRENLADWFWLHRRWGRI